MGKGVKTAAIGGVFAVLVGEIDREDCTQNEPPGSNR